MKMKINIQRKHLFAALISIPFVLSICVLASSQRKEIFSSNVDALSRSESSNPCTGPKTETLNKSFICRSINSNPCKDLQGCQ